MAASRPAWLAELSRSFKRHRHGRPGWFIEVHRDKLRVRSNELPPRPDASGGQIHSVTLRTPPGPSTAATALREACELFDQVEAGTWRWPEAGSIPAATEADRLTPEVLDRLMDRLHERLVGEQLTERTWQRMYRPYYQRLMVQAAKAQWCSDHDLLVATLRQWESNSRARQMAHDRIRTLWREAVWPWPEEAQALRGNGRAAADPQGVRGFTDPEIEELRARIQRSHRLTASDLLVWDLLTVFGLRPAELQGLKLSRKDSSLVAEVTRAKKSSRGSSGPRLIPAVPPPGWPADCYSLLRRWREHGPPEGLVRSASPGQGLTQQLRRLQGQMPIKIEIPAELTAYGMRHAFALRLGLDLGLSVREAAELMGHSPAVHLSTYGRRLETPKLHEKVAALVRAAEK